MKLISIALLMTVSALADDKAMAEAQAALAAAQCYAAKTACTITTTYAEPAWLWKDGLPVTTKTVTTVTRVEAPPTPPAPIIVYPARRSPVVVVVKK